MARGWESKSVEAQQEESARAQRTGPELRPEERARLERRRSLELARARALDDLGRAAAPAHKSLLQATLDAIQRDLDALG